MDSLLVHAYSCKIYCIAFLSLAYRFYGIAVLWCLCPCPIFCPSFLACQLFSLTCIQAYLLFPFLRNIPCICSHLYEERNLISHCMGVSKFDSLLSYLLPYEFVFNDVYHKVPMFTFLAITLCSCITLS